ncbi:MAG: hypothetical protein OXK77_18215, partial [Gemmatimonadota bacterium]|nr:hypothetical protein [Gemmatimonadota bacterium]
AVSAADPDRVYVLIEAPGDTGGVYRSDDRGASWRQVTDFQPIRNRPFYYNNLEGHPTDPDILWGMAEGHWKSVDGGVSWVSERTPHGDNHDMWINPENPSILIQSNDGGANISLDGGMTWSTQLNQPTAELYQVDVSDDFPYRLYAGQQDNSTISVPGLPERSEPGGSQSTWEAHGGCETGPVVPKPGDPDIVYANCKGRFGLYNRRTGQEAQYYVGFGNLYGHNPRDLEYRFQRVVPIHVSPHDPNKVYHGSQYVHVTTNGGQYWETISPDLTAFTPETQVVPNHHPVRVVREDPDREGLLYLGTEFGMFISFDDGGSWQPFQLNLPATPITDMKVVQGDLVLSTMGRGFWILDNLTPLHELSDRVAGADAHLFDIRDAYRLRYGGGFGGFRPRDPHEPEFPQAGAQIDYMLASAVRGPVTLDIVASSGEVVRSFSSEGPGEYTVPAEPGMREWQLERFGTPRLPSDAGTHRFTWDLTYPGPWDASPARAGRGGPMVPPGTYTARLTAGDWSASRSFDVMLDPRVVAEGVGEDVVMRQVELALQARDALSEGRLAVHRINEARQRGGGNLAAEIEAIERELVTAPRRYSRPMLVDQLQYLYSNLTRADQEPGQDAIVRYDQLNTALEEHVSRLERLLRANISDEGDRPEASDGMGGGAGSPVDAASGR